MNNKILINVSSVKYPLTGIGYYTINILNELVKRQVDVISFCDGVFFDSDKTKDFICKYYGNVNFEREKSHIIRKKFLSIIRNVPGVYTLRNKYIGFKLRKKLEFYARKGFIYFEPNFIPFYYDGDIFTTIHDLSFISYPEFHPKTRVQYLTNRLSDAIERSKHVFVDSDFIYNELAAYNSLSISKTSTLYLGVDQEFGDQTMLTSEITLHKFGLENKKYILSVCTLEPRKNLARLIEAYSSLPLNLRQKYPLVLVGNSGWKNHDMIESIASLVDSSQLRFTGYISDEELKQVYSGALIFAYPSLYEGFGLPIIEAMASGVPVLTSNCGATKEISGEAALLVNPMSIEDIRLGLLSLLSDSSLRDKFIESGFYRADKFNWVHTVDKLLDTINSQYQ